MPKKKAQDTGPSTFLEWVVGTTVQSATRPRRPKSTRRDMVRIQLSTDDEDETDSLHVTYPRSGRTAATKARGTKDGSKKVHFENVPRKSALKKTTTTVTEIETDEESTDVETSEDEKPVRKAKVKRGKKEEESEEDSESHSPCRCIDCIRARQKAKKKVSAKKGVVESEDSDSEVSTKNSKGGKKRGKKAETESESEDTDSEPENKKSSKKDKQQKGGKKEKFKPTEDSSADEEKPTKKEKRQQKNEANSSKKRQQQKEQGDNKKGNYPEGLPEPHPRRPNYIEPIRAEVVQTERVIEGPEDPKPNAYYDAEHNIIRVYHGPVYGQNHGQGLYPKRDPNGRVLPMGTPHPSQNPWFNGFKDNQGETNVPVTQGMPMNSIYPPPGPYGYPPPHMGYPGPPQMEGGWNRGAFAQMGGANGQGDNKSATNNVGPGSVKVSFWYTPSNVDSELTSRRQRVLRARITPITNMPQAMEGDPSSVTGAPTRAVARTTTRTTAAPTTTMVLGTTTIITTTTTVGTWRMPTLLRLAAGTTNLLSSPANKTRSRWIARVNGEEAVTAAKGGKTQILLLGITLVPTLLLLMTGMLQSLVPRNHTSEKRTMWPRSRLCPVLGIQRLPGAIRVLRPQRGVLWIMRLMMGCPLVGGRCLLSRRGQVEWRFRRRDSD